jgi:hypothetical protein
MKDIRNNKDKTGYAQHILNTGHTYGMEIIQITNKGHMINTIEKYHICKAIKEGIHLNDTHTHNKNPISDTIYNSHYITG